MATPTIRLRLNFVGTVKTSPTNGLTFASATTATGTWTSAPSRVPAIAAPSYLEITVGTEIVWLVTYPGSGTTGTFLRGRETSTAASHTKAPWGNVPTTRDAAPQTPPATTVFGAANFR